MDLAPVPEPDVQVAAELARKLGLPEMRALLARRRELEPEGAFAIRDASGAWIARGQAVVWPMDEGGLAWLSGMMVDPAWQRRGAGRAILARLLAYAQENGAHLVGLDASVQGKSLYVSEGFVEVASMPRWRRDRETPAPELPPGEHALYPISSCEVMELVAYDRPRFGASRARLLALLMARFPERAFVAFHRGTGAIGGYAMATERGIGPLVADTPELALRLLLACERAGAPARAGLHGLNPDAEKLFLQAGYKPEDVATTRMIRGGPLPGRPSTQFAIGGWDLG